MDPCHPLADILVAITALRLFVQIFNKRIATPSCSSISTMHPSNYVYSALLLLAALSSTTAQHVLTTPLTWQNALAACNSTFPGSRLFPPPTNYGETWIYAFVRNLTAPTYWIQRRGATTCTAVPNYATDLGNLQEYSCDGEQFPAICT